MEARPVFSETWHAKKVHELDPSLLTPMARQGFKDFYVKELAQLTDGSFVIPVRWVKREGELWAHALEVSNTDVSKYNRVYITDRALTFDLEWAHRAK